jgi:hypothetical protein
MASQKPVCVVYYKKGWLDSGTLYGEAFDRLDACCGSFKDTFHRTGNTKSRTFGTGDLYTEGNGLNFVVRGKLDLFLCGEAVKFCPWCGASVEVKCSRDVTLRQKTREVPDGFEEVARNT